MLVVPPPQPETLARLRARTIKHPTWTHASRLEKPSFLFGLHTRSNKIIRKQSGYSCNGLLTGGPGTGTLGGVAAVRAVVGTLTVSAAGFVPLNCRLELDNWHVAAIGAPVQFKVTVPL